MTWTNTKDSYGWLAIALHWIAAFGVIAMFASGLAADAAHEQGDRATFVARMGLHISIGATLFAFFAARIILHYTQPTPVKPVQANWLNVLATAVHHLLLLGILIQIVSGPLAVWSGGRAINIFGIVALPSPFGARVESVHEFAETLHLVGRATIFITLPIHVLGALKHLVFDRDGVFSRIIRPGPLKAPAA